MMLLALQTAHEKDPSLPLGLSAKFLACLVVPAAFVVYVECKEKPSAPEGLVAVPLAIFIAASFFVTLAGILSSLFNAPVTAGRWDSATHSL